MGESRLMERQTLCQGGMYYITEERGYIFISDSREQYIVSFMCSALSVGAFCRESVCVRAYFQSSI